MRRLNGRSTSVDVDPNGNLLLRVWDHRTPGDGVEVVIPPSAVPDLLRDIVGQGTKALQNVAQAIAAGDCATCRNARLVEPQAPAGRTELVHCPDCTPPEPFTDYPAIGGGLTRGGLPADD